MEQPGAGLESREARTERGRGEGEGEGEGARGGGSKREQERAQREPRISLLCRAYVILAPARITQGACTRACCFFISMTCRYYVDSSFICFVVESDFSPTTTGVHRATEAQRREGLLKYGFTR